MIPPTTRTIPTADHEAAAFYALDKPDSRSCKNRPRCIERYRNKSLS